MRTRQWEGRPRRPCRDGYSRLPSASMLPILATDLWCVSVLDHNHPHLHPIAYPAPLKGLYGTQAEERHVFATTYESAPLPLKEARAAEIRTTPTRVRRKSLVLLCSHSAFHPRSAKTLGTRPCSRSAKTPSTTLTRSASIRGSQ